VVYAYADCGAVLAADVKEIAEALVEALEFLGIFLVGIFQLLELTGRVYIVAGIDAYFLDDGCGNICDVWVEMYVGTEWYMGVSALVKSLADVAQVFGFACSLRGKTNQLSACLYDAYCLLYATLCVHCGACCHTLHGNWVVASDA
jgi:hypothetical protein